MVIRTRQLRTSNKLRPNVPLRAHAATPEKRCGPREGAVLEKTPRTAAFALMAYVCCFSMCLRRATLPLSSLSQSSSSPDMLNNDGDGGE